MMWFCLRLTCSPGAGPSVSAPLVHEHQALAFRSSASTDRRESGRPLARSRALLHSMPPPIWRTIRMYGVCLHLCPITHMIAGERSWTREVRLLDIGEEPTNGA